MGKEEYEVASSKHQTVINGLTFLWEKLGKPTSVFNGGEKLMDGIIAAWSFLEPQESLVWAQQRDNHLEAEMTIKEQVKGHTGRNLISYPELVYKFMGLFFTDDKLISKDFIFKFLKKYPMFRLVNKV